VTSTDVKPSEFDGSVFGVDEVGANGVQFRRHTWLRTPERRFPRDASANVSVRTTTIPPGGATEWRVVNGVVYAMVLAGEPTVNWADGEVEGKPAGTAFTLDIGRVHRIANPATAQAAILLSLHVTGPDREHVVAVVPRPAAD
jgi:quercetin dioxygenase-like cupin family protein